MLICRRVLTRKGWVYVGFAISKSMADPAFAFSYFYHMSTLFNKTFFRFLFGFLAIIVFSFVILSIVGYYEENKISEKEMTARSQ